MIEALQEMLYEKHWEFCHRSFVTAISRIGTCRIWPFCFSGVISRDPSKCYFFSVQYMFGKRNR